MKILKQEEDQDRLSELPDAIIYRIFSFIPTAMAVRMSILSKRWRHMWVSSPELYVGQLHSEKFNDFINRCLELHDIHMLKRFKLHMPYHKKVRVRHRAHIDALLNTIVDRSKLLKEIDICLNINKEYFKRTKFHLKKEVIYSLREEVLRVDSLTVLKLENIKLQALKPVKLPSLKSASLKHVLLDNKNLGNLLLGCPSMQDLLLRSCRGLRTTTKLSHKNLRSFEVNDTFCGREIRFEAENLESFVYNGGSSYDEARRRVGNQARKIYINFASSCERLRSVSVSKAVLNHNWVEALFSRHPQLERLSLHSCNGYKRITWIDKLLFVSSSEDDGEMTATTIATPKLVSFSFEPDILPDVLGNKIV